MKHPRRAPTRENTLWRSTVETAAAAAAEEVGAETPAAFLPALREGAALLALAALESRPGLPPCTAHRQMARALPVESLLAAMRRAVLSSARTTPLPHGLTLSILEALERVGVSLERDSGHRFASMLRGSGALELLVDVAHDMRSPLGSILFLAEQVRQGRSGPVTAVQERQLGLIYGAAHGLGTLASDVMEVARGGNSLLAAAPHPFSLQGIGAQLEDIIRPMVEERKLAFVVDIAAADSRCGHAGALQRVLLNLVSNAVKFTETGSVTLRITATGPHRVHFSVSDTGRGIPPHVVATIFDTFRRRVTPGQYVFSSAGLGLSICQTLLQRMGSELRVESVEGHGTTFDFELELPLHGPDHAA